MQLVVALQTAEKAEADDDGIRKVYVKGSKDPASKSLHAAVAQAAKTGLDIGGTLTVTYTGDGEPSRRGYTAPKQYTASYAGPANTFLADTVEAAPATTTAAPPTPATPATAPAAAATTPAATAQALLAAGTDHATIAQVTGLDLAVIAALANLA
jgi:hypothetical protein